MNKNKKKKEKVFPPENAFELTKEEKELIGNPDDYNPVSENKKKQILRTSQKAAQDKRVNLRISSKLLEDIKVESERQGINYQAFIKSILHQYMDSGTVIIKLQKHWWEFDGKETYSVSVDFGRGIMFQDQNKEERLLDYIKIQGISALKSKMPKINLKEIEENIL